MRLQQMQTIYDLQLKLNERILKARFGYSFEDMNEEQKCQWILNFCRATNHELYELEDAILDNDTQNIVVEAVDVVHFLVSIGQVLGLHPKKNSKFNFRILRSTTRWLEKVIAKISRCRRLVYEIEDTMKWKWWGYKTNQFTAAKQYFYILLNSFNCLISMLGITEEQLFDVYCQKNKINHERQDEGYNIDTKTEDDNRSIKVHLHQTGNQ